MINFINEWIMAGESFSKTEKFIYLLLIKIVAVIAIIVFFVVLSKVAMYLNHRGMRKRAVISDTRNETIASIIDDLIKYVFSIICLVTILPLLGVNSKAILASSGVLAIVISVGGATFINDFINGFFALFEGYFDVGDFVRINSYEGTILEIGLKTTVLLSANNEFIAIPNSTIVEVVNLSKYDFIQYPVASISYDQDVDFVLEKVAPEIVENLKETGLFTSIKCLGVTELAASCVNIKFEIRSHAQDRFEVERQFYYHVKTIFDKHNIEIPFNQLVLHNANV